MPQPLIIQSQTGGLWVRFFIRLMLAWGTTVLFLVGMVGFVVSDLEWDTPVSKVVLLLFSLALFGYVTYIRYLDNPLRWRNTVRFDPELRIITVTRQHDVSKAVEVLDYEGKKIPFDAVTYIKSDVYDSFLTGANYLFRVKTRGLTIRLFAVRHPDEYVSILGRISKEMGIAVE